MILARLETSHFSFIALGVDREHAEATMRQAWDRHAKEYRHRGVLPFEEFAEDVNYSEIERGGALRDGEPLLVPEILTPEAGESYTPAGLPKRAAQQARAKGAKINYVFTGDDIAVQFPNGSRILARTTASAKRTGRPPGEITSRRRSAAGGRPPLGDTLEVALNNFVRTAR